MGVNVGAGVSVVAGVDHAVAVSVGSCVSVGGTKRAVKVAATWATARWGIIVGCASTVLDGAESSVVVPTARTSTAAKARM